MRWLEILISIVFSGYVLYRKDLFLLWIPFLSLTGRWLLVMDILPREYSSMCSYVEILMIILILIDSFKDNEKFDLTAIYIFLIGISSAFSLIQSNGHFYFSLFFVFCFFSGPWIYLFLLKQIKKNNLLITVDLIVLIWTCLGYINKIIFGYLSGESAIFQRVGGYFGSNRLANILILLLPLVKRKWIIYLASILLLSQFSKGIYGALILYLILWIIIINRKILRMLIPIAVICAIFLPQILNITFTSNSKPMTLKKNLIGRMTKADEDSLWQSLYMRIMIDERFDIWKFGLERGKESSFTGIGLGGSLWEFQKHTKEIYSNFHNIYLTLLVEGGIVHMITFIIFLFYILLRSFLVNSYAFIGLFTWSFYGLYNGQLFDVSRAPTCADYYYLLLVAAIVSYSYEKSLQTKNKKMPFTL